MPSRASTPKAAKRQEKKSTDTQSAAQLEQRGRELTSSLGEVVAVLLRDRRFRHMTLHELEAAVVPAILNNQIMLMRGAVRTKSEGEDSEEGTLQVPVGLGLWASVSDEVHEKLQRQVSDKAGYRLAPGEWRSGYNFWLLALVGPQQTLPALEQRIVETVFGDKPFERHSYAAPQSESQKGNGSAVEGTRRSEAEPTN